MAVPPRVAKQAPSGQPTGWAVLAGSAASVCSRGTSPSPLPLFLLILLLSSTPFSSPVSVPLLQWQPWLGTAM